MNIKPHLLIGLALVAIFWFASWTRLGVLGEYSFFPLWLGYILTVDALVARRKGESILTRSPRAFVGLFLLSMPVWWIFEFHNYFLVNWHYLIPNDYSALHIIVESTICFSIVVPAVFDTAELIATVDFVTHLTHPPPSIINRRLRRWKSIENRFKFNPILSDFHLLETRNSSGAGARSISL